MNTNQGQQAQLDFQRVKILYKHAYFAITGAVFSAAILGFVLYDNLPFKIWVTWLACALSVVPIRALLIANFYSYLNQGLLNASKALTMEKWWLLATALPAISFVSSAFLPYENNQLIIRLFIGLVLLSMIAGNIISSITSVKTIMVFLHLTIIPYVASCFMGQGHYFNILGSFFIAFYFVFFSLTIKMHNTVLNAIEQQIERQDMAYKDSLTGLWNRRKLFEVVDQIGDKSYCILLIDIDHFKKLNDNEGHQKGDEVLGQISFCVVRCCDNEDMIVRYGGEEFLVLLPGKDLDSAERVADKINAEVAAECTNTVSIGVAYSNLYKDFDAVVNAADHAMYRAKTDGRNCVRTDNPHLEKFL